MESVFPLSTLVRFTTLNREERLTQVKKGGGASSLLSLIGIVQQMHGVCGDISEACLSALVP